MANGWMGKILRVDLTKGVISTVDTMKYVPKFIGGWGVATRIAWEELPRGMSAFDPENRLMFMVGPLTGTLSPSSGRCTVCGIGPQTIPEMYTEASIGGYWPSELKYAGWDGVIVQGKAAAPCYILIKDGDVKIMDASKLWGLGTFDTQKALFNLHGKDVHSYVIGPAGEKLSRIACISSDTENAAGQGGFGGLMGAKNLKAICVKGTGQVKVADPNALLAVRKEYCTQSSPSQVRVVPASGSWGWDSQTIKDLQYRRAPHATCEGCNAPCHPFFQDVPRKTRTGYHSGVWGCIGPMPTGWMTQGGMTWPLWDLGFEAGFEIGELLNDYGLNEWDILGGMMPWISMASKVGVLTKDIVGMPIEMNSPTFWRDLMHMIAYREGFGDLLAEGTTRAIDKLGVEKFGNTMYRGQRQFLAGNPRGIVGPQVDTPISLQHSWGFAGHDCGREIHPYVKYPDWLIRALMWMTFSRDVQSAGHIKSTAEWNTEFYKDPYRGEKGVAIAIYNETRVELKNSLTLCDSRFPRPQMSGAEAAMYSAVTGIATTEAQLDQAADRVRNQFRAIIIRNNDRDRTMELKQIMPWYKRPDCSAGIAIDEAEFNIMVDTYLRQRGWDKKTGWPTRATYEKLDLKDVADSMATIGKLPV